MQSTRYVRKIASSFIAGKPPPTVRVCCAAALRRRRGGVSYRFCINQQTSIYIPPIPSLLHQFADGPFAEHFVQHLIHT